MLRIRGDHRRQARGSIAAERRKWVDLRAQASPVTLVFRLHPKLFSLGDPPIARRRTRAVKALSSARANASSALIAGTRTLVHPLLGEIMRAVKQTAKISGLVAAMLAGAMLASGDEAAARGMSGGSRSPALVNTIHPIINNNNPGKSYGGSRRHDGDHKERKAKRKHCKKTGTCPPKYVGKPIPGQPAPSR